MQNSDELRLRNLEDEWIKCYISGDKAVYDRIVADDFTGTDESGAFRNKNQDRSLLPPAPVTGSTAINEDVKVRLYGETAVITGRIVTKVKAGAQEVIGFNSRFTDTWIKRRGDWQVVARHYSRVPMERRAVKVDTRIYDNYVGEYELAPGIVFTVSKDEDKLFGQGSNQPKVELYPESEIVFFLRETPALFFFIRNDKGQVSQLLIVQDGRVTSSRKNK